MITHECGIAGFMKLNRDCNIRYDNLEAMFEALEQRGTDATGFCYSRNKEPVVVKVADKATVALKSGKFKKHLELAAESPWGLFHCRAATNGSARNNKNNHPIYSRESLIIHNGIVQSKKIHKNKAGTTDTEDILLSLDKLGLKGIEKISGSMAIAYHKFAEPNSFYLYRHWAPIQFWITDSMIVFASTDFILEYAFVLQKVKPMQLPEDSFYRLSPKGLKFINTYKPANGYLYSNYYNSDFVGTTWYYNSKPQSDATAFEEAAKRLNLPTDTTAPGDFVPLKYRLKSWAHKGSKIVRARYTPWWGHNGYKHVEEADYAKIETP